MGWTLSGTAIIGAIYGCSAVDTRTSLQRFEAWDSTSATVKRAQRGSECAISITFRATAQRGPVTIRAIDERCSWLLVRPIPKDADG